MVADEDEVEVTEEASPTTNAVGVTTWESVINNWRIRMTIAVMIPLLASLVRLGIETREESE